MELHIGKETENKVDKRVIYLKKFPESNDEIMNDPEMKKNKWRFSALKNVEFDRDGNVLTISKEQAERSTVLAVSELIGAMEWNADKVEYYVNNGELNAKITVMSEWVYAKKFGYPDIHNCVVTVEDNTTGKKFFSCNNEEDDGTYTTVNGEAFPSYCIITDSYFVLDYIDVKGKLPPSDELKLKETDFDQDSISKERVRKPEVVYSDEIVYERKEYKTVYVPMTDHIFSCNAEHRMRQAMLFDEPAHFYTVNLTAPDAPVLNVEKDHDLYSIGIIDEMNGTVYYYNNGDTSGEYTELDGETYPNFMITRDTSLVLSVFKFFIENGKPYDKVLWITEEL